MGWKFSNLENVFFQISNLLRNLDFGKKSPVFSKLEIWKFGNTYALSAGKFADINIIFDRVLQIFSAMLFPPTNPRS